MDDSPASDSPASGHATNERPVDTVHPHDLPRLVEVGEASVRATHHFVSETDIEAFGPIVPDSALHLALACIRDDAGQVVGFVVVGRSEVDGTGKPLAAHEALGANGVMAP